jgi:hypothetical protein
MVRCPQQVSSFARRGGVVALGEDNGGPPLPRRVPGAADSPTPPARREAPVLPESVRQRVLAAVAEFHEREATSEEVTSRDQVVPAQPSEAAVPADPPVSAEPAVPSEPAVQLPGRPLFENGGRPPAEVKRAVLPAPRPSLWANPEAPTEEFESFSGVPASDTVSAGVAEIATQSALPGQQDSSAQNPGTEQTAAAVATSAKRKVGQQASRRKRRSGRRYRLAGALVSVTALVTVGSLALVVRGHTAPPAPVGHEASADARGREMATRNLAAAWIVGQVSRAAVVSCDPVMFGVLKAHGFPASDLYELGTNTTSPLRSEVVVATEAVRAQFGNLLSSVYAPAVIASFGSGPLRIDIREIAPNGAAAYRTAVKADVLARKATGAQLLRTNRITVSATAQRQLAAGRVDMRLLIAIAGMASVHPIYIVGFSSSAPSATAGIPLRFADVTESGHVGTASRSAATALQSLVKYLGTLRAPYNPARAQVIISAGQAVLHIEFTAPSPLDLLNLPKV